MTSHVNHSNHLSSMIFSTYFINGYYPTKFHIQNRGLVKLKSWKNILVTLRN